MMSKDSINTGVPFERKSVLEYSLSLCIAAVCALLQQEMGGQAIHLFDIQLGSKQTLNSHPPVPHYILEAVVDPAFLLKV